MSRLTHIDDAGRALMVDVSDKPATVREAVAQGAGIVTFSGDKLLGGPQAGFIVGKKALIAAINDNPLKRALRVDKIRLAAIAATLNIYRAPARLKEHLPTLRLLVRPAADIAALARRLLPRVADLIGPNYAVSVCACQSQIGSGALPLDSIDSAGVRIDAGGGALERLAAALRLLERPVRGRISEGSLTLDFRCLDDEKGFLRSLSGLARRQESDGRA